MSDEWAKIFLFKSVFSLIVLGIAQEYDRICDYINREELQDSP